MGVTPPLDYEGDLKDYLLGTYKCSCGATCNTEWCHKCGIRNTNKYNASRSNDTSNWSSNDFSSYSTPSFNTSYSDLSSSSCDSGSCCGGD